MPEIDPLRTRIGPVRIPVAPGEVQPDDIYLTLADIQKVLATMLVKTSRGLRVPLADDDGVQFFKSRTSADDVLVTYTKIVKAVAAAGTGLTLAVDGTYARKIILEARKVNGANTGIVHLGDSTIDKTTAQMFTLTPGDIFTRSVPVGQKFDLNDIWIDADNSADAVVGQYLAVT